MKKRIRSAVLAFMIAAASLGGCGRSGKDTADASVITIWHDKEDAVAQVLQKQLDQLAPEVTVKLERKSDLTEALKMVGNDPKAAPDMYFFAHDKIGVYAEMGILSPVTDFIPREELDPYMDMTIRAATYQDVVYQLPVYYETLLFMYNKRYMKEEEVPRTTEELYSYMQGNTKGGHYGFVEQHSTAYYSAGWIHGFGGYIMNDQGEPGLDLPQTQKALAYHKKFVELMPGESEYATVNTLFSEGKAHATIAGPWLVPTVRQAGMDLGIAPMPVVEETGMALAPYSGVQGIQVLKNAGETKKEAVEKVLRQLMDPRLQVDLAKASGCAPASEACYDMEEITSDDVVMAMKQTAENAVPMPNRPEMDVMWTVAGNLLADINMSGRDVEESCAGAQKEALRLIGQMK
nr:extracellular solute-binding protein [uncultured Eisenbergiella sp.]